MNYINILSSDNYKFVLAMVVILSVVCIIISFIKKAVKLAIFCSAITMLSGFGLSAMNVYQNNLGLSLVGKTITINNKYSSNINFDLDDVKDIVVDSNTEANDKMKVTVGLKDSSSKEFFINRQYEKMVKEIINKK